MEMLYKYASQKGGFSSKPDVPAPDVKEGPAPKPKKDTPDINLKIDSLPGEDDPVATPLLLQAGGKEGDKGGKKEGKQILKVSGELTKKDTEKDGFFQKVHKIELTSGKKYKIDLVASKEKFFDAYLLLRDAKGNVLAQNDDGGGDKNARLSFTPKKTEMYEIVVTSFAEGETGKYTLTVTE
jgi:hypothetical protein